MVENEAAAPVEAPQSNVLADLKKENLEMQAELQKREEFLKQRDELKAREMLHGRSQAGASAPKEETPKEYAARILRGGK